MGRRGRRALCWRSQSLCSENDPRRGAASACRGGVTHSPRTRDMCDTGEVFVTEQMHRTPVTGGVTGRWTAGECLVRMSGQNIDRAPCPALQPGKATGKGADGVRPRHRVRTGVGPVSAARRREASHTRVVRGSGGAARPVPARCATRVQIASGAGGRFALAGAKCERRLPARHGPAPEVLPTGTVEVLGLADAPGAHTPTCVYAGTETADTVSGAPSPPACWDGPVTAAATRSSATGAHEPHARHVSTRRRHL